MKIHLDLDCYFVSAERKRYPFLKNKNVVVAKSSDKKIFSKQAKKGYFLGATGAFNSTLEFKNNYSGDIASMWREEFIDENGYIHGIVIAKSYEAKEYGIKTGTPLKDAIVMCPNLIIIPSDHLYYQEISMELRAYLEKKIPILEQYSIDEFFGDLNGWIKDSDTLEFIRQLRNDILQKFDLPITIGASKSKWIAKLLTDKNKPFGAFALEQEKVFAYTFNTPIEEFSGIGRKIEARLKSYHIKTLGQLQANKHLLKQYGKAGDDLYKRICGEDNEKVIPFHDRKGIGISRNFAAIKDRSEVFRRVTILARYLCFSIFKLQLNPSTFYFKIRYQYGIKKSFSISVTRLFNENFFINFSKKMVKKLDVHLAYKIHYIAISASNFITKKNIKIYELLDYNQDLKYKHLSKSLKQIRQKHGIDSIKYANELHM